MLLLHCAIDAHSAIANALNSVLNVRACELLVGLAKLWRLPQVLQP
jgi:hypothetical protein